MTTSMFTNYARFVKSLAKPLGTFAADLHHMATGCATEAGEFLSTTKKIWVYGQTIDTVNKEGSTHRVNAVEELGDMLFYIQGAANLLGYTLEKIAQENMEKLQKRYPTGYSDALAAQRLDKIEEGREAQ